MLSEAKVGNMIKKYQTLLKCEGRYLKFRGNESWYWRLRGNLEVCYLALGIPFEEA